MSGSASEPSDRSATARAGGWTDAVRAVCALLLVCLVVATVIGRLLDPDFRYTLWSSRDLVRATLLATEPQVVGAELSNGIGARLPGGLQYGLLLLPLLGTEDPLPVYRFLVVLEGLGLVVLFLAVRARFGAWAGAVAIAGTTLSLVTSDTMRTLWNPALLPFFSSAAVAAALRVAWTRDASALPALALATALGSQCHLSMALLGSCLAVAVAALRPSGLGRAAALSAAAVLVAYLPYLAHEATHGWPNTRMLLVPSQVEDIVSLADTGGRDADNALAVARHLVGLPAAARLAAGEVPGHVLALLLAAGPLVGVLGLVAPWPVHLGGAPARRTAGVIGGALLLGVAAYAWSRGVSVNEATLRYLLVLMPLLGVATAIGGLALEARLRERAGRGLALVVPLLITGSLSARAAAIHAIDGPRDFGAWSVRNDLLDALRGVLDAPLDAVAGRTVILERMPGHPWTWSQSDAVDYELLREGRRFPGSLTGPCAALLIDGQHALRPDDDLVALLHASFGPWVPPIRHAERFDGPHGSVIIRYAHVDPEIRCRTSLSGRYVLTPNERLTFALFHALDPGSARELPSPAPGTRRVAAMLGVHDDQERVAALLDLSVAPGEVSVRLHANQLRGQAFNDGFFLDVALRAPHLELVRRDGARATIELAESLLGRRGVLTPVSASEAVPPGTWGVWLVGDVVQLDQIETWPPPSLPVKPARTRLLPALVVPRAAKGPSLSAKP